MLCVLIVLTTFFSIFFLKNTKKIKLENFQETEKRKCFYTAFYTYGFFSEYLNLIGCNIWCQENNIDMYVEYSKNNIGDFETYFVPLYYKKVEIEENFVGRSIKSKYPEKILLAGNYMDIRNDYGMIGYISKTRREQYRKEIEKTYIFNEVFQKKVDEEIEKYKSLIGDDFAAFHVRRGDKIVEQKAFALNTYIDKLKEIEKNREKKIKNIFIVSDDNNIFKEFKENFPEYNFFSRYKRQAGYDQLEHNLLSPDDQREQIENFLIDIEIIRASKFAVVTSVSNVGAFLMMSMYPRCYSIDTENDKVFIN